MLSLRHGKKHLRWSLAAICAVGICICMICGCGRADYGICIVSPDGVAGANEESFYPMHSVMKFPQAIYVADRLCGNGIPLDSALVVRKDELMQDTWSPMLGMMDESGSFSFRDLLRLSLAESDNNACDLLFDYCGGPFAVEQFVKQLGFNDIRIAVTERQMHEDTALAELNCCTPKEMTSLLLWFNEHKDDNEYYRTVWDIMAACNTGAERIPAAFGPDCRIIHKTGTGFAPEGVLPPMNDAGIVILPDGRLLAITVFVPKPKSKGEVAEIVKVQIEHETSTKELLNLE